MYHDNKAQVQSPMRTYLIIALHEQWAIFNVLELYSTNQIPFCHIGLHPITCYFPAFLYIFQLHCPTPLKKIHMELNTTDIGFSTQFSHI